MVNVLLNKVNLPNEVLRKNKIVSTSFNTTNTKILITPILLWKSILVYNGKKYIPFNITKEKIGYKIIELIKTKSISNIKNKSEYKIKIK